MTKELFTKELVHDNIKREFVEFENKSNSDFKKFKVNILNMILDIGESIE